MGAGIGDASRVAIIGGGPAGSFFGYFLLDMAERVGLRVQVDTYEPRDFSRPGPGGCNMCGGIVYEALVQHLALEGIDLPPSVVQRGIDSYVLHTDAGSVRLQTPVYEKRIGSVYRGIGPRDIRTARWASFDGHLQSFALEKGVRLVQSRVDEVERTGDRFHVKARDGSLEAYDLLAVAAGVNSGVLKRLEGLGLGYRPPRTTQAAVREYHLGEESVERYLGSAMHIFLLDIPRLRFAAVIPKGDYVTVCLIGQDIDAPLLQRFLQAPAVRECFPSGWAWDRPACHCSPHINVAGAIQPYADGIVFLGDCGVTRLYKDGIGAAYKAAKAAATTVIFHGISAEDFRRHYWPACRALSADNAVGRVVFAVTRQIQRRRFASRAMLRMVAAEQQQESAPKRMSAVLWDMFSGSTSYREIFLRTLHPLFLSRWATDLAISALPDGRHRT